MTTIFPTPPPRFSSLSYLIVGLVTGIAAFAGVVYVKNWWLSPSPSPTPAIVITSKGALQQNHLIELQAKAAFPITWRIISTGLDFDYIDEGDGDFWFVPRFDGQFRVAALGVLKGKPIYEEKTLTIGFLPPGPGPGPTPPGPGPSPPPFAATGLHVLMVYDDKNPMPSQQAEIFKNVPFRATLDSLTPISEDGKTHAWRMWPSSVNDVSAEAKVWQDAWGVTRKGLPWIVISNGTNGTSEPLPPSISAVTALIQKYVK